GAEGRDERGHRFTERHLVGGRDLGEERGVAPDARPTGRSGSEGCAQFAQSVHSVRGYQPGSRHQSQPGQARPPPRNRSRSVATTLRAVRTDVRGFADGRFSSETSSVPKRPLARRRTWFAVAAGSAIRRTRVRSGPIPASAIVARMLVVAGWARA